MIRILHPNRNLQISFFFRNRHLPTPPIPPWNLQTQPGAMRSHSDTGMRLALLGRFTWNLKKPDFTQTEMVKWGLMWTRIWIHPIHPPQWLLWKAKFCSLNHFWINQICTCIVREAQGWVFVMKILQTIHGPRSLWLDQQLILEW